MGETKSQRLINLVVVLLTAKRFLSREEIRPRVDGYAGKDEAAFRRMFERDKDELRRMGIAVVTGSNDLDSGEDDAYRIESSSFFLPEIKLTPTEATLVGLASTVWSQDEVAADVRAAVAKLRAAGEEITQDALETLKPRLAAREPAFLTLWQALLARQPVKFTYHQKMRRVNPWRLMLRWGAWYLVCQMRDGSEPKVRIFKLARMETQPELISGHYTAPDPRLVDEKARELEPPAPLSQALLAIRLGAVPQLRRRGQPVDEPAPEGYDLVSLPYAREADIVATVLEAGSNVLVLDPPQVRDQVIARLTSLCAAAPADDLPHDAPAGALPGRRARADGPKPSPKTPTPPIPHSEEGS